MQNKPRESGENKFVALLNSIIDPVVIVDEKGRILLVNNAFEGITGLSKNKVIGTVFLEMSILPPESKAIMLENLKKRMQGLPVEPYEIAFTDKNGELKYVEINAKKIDYPGQSADLVIFRDVTRRKENARQLKEYSEKMEALVEEKVKEIKESEAKFRAISTCAKDAIVVAGSEGEIVYWNPAAEKIFGYSHEEAVGKNVLKLLVPPQHYSFQQKFVALVQGSQLIQGEILEFIALRKDGIEFPAELSMALMNFKGKSCLLGIVRDVSERKKMEATIEQERSMLESATANIGASLTVISKDYRVLWANKVMKYFNGDCEGKICYVTLGHSDDVCSDCGVKKIFENGVSVDRHDWFYTDGKGRTDWVELIATPLKDKEGNVVAALELGVNVTARKQMQDQLKEYSQKLEKLVDERTAQLRQTQAKLVKAEKLAVIGELAGMIGHDLRNPLTGIKGAAYYLKTKHGPEIGATGKEMLEIIEKAIDHSNKIINDLLGYSSKLSLELTETTSKLLLRNALAFIDVPERIQIVDVTKNKPKIKADIEKISKVFVNIITNAIDAMPTTGTLTITSKAAGDNVKIVFKDIGTGMTEETLSKLKLGFPLFTTKATGMGFGLPICKRIIEAHSGKISIKSPLGKGTTVTITLPVNPKPTDEGEEKWIFNESILRTMRTAQETP
jgi:PAS domain S-box-containing protein